MNQNILLTVIESAVSIILEGVILGFIFQWISSKSQEKQRQEIEKEMKVIEKQNNRNMEMFITDIYEAKTEIISQIKESTELKK